MRFDCTEVSSLIYLSSSPRFQRDGDAVYLRTAGQFKPLPGNAARQRRVYSDLNGGLVWAIDVDGEVLRGSGRPVPPAVAAYFGVTPAGSVRLELPGTAATLQYSGALVTTSSLRIPAETIRASQGDRLLFRLPDRGDWMFDVARQNDDSATSALAFVGMGDREADNPRGALAASCWQADPTLLRETLWDRREERLLSLLGVPPTDPRGNVLDLRQVDGLLGERRPSRHELASSAGIGRQGLATDAGDGRARLNSTESTLIVRRIAEITGLSQREIELAAFGSPIDASHQPGP